MKKGIYILVGAIVLLLLSACSGEGEISEGKQTIKIGYLPITHAVPLYMQQDAEYEDYELQLVKFGSWPELMDALNTGKIDGASVLIQLAMNAKEKGVDLKAVALGHRDGNVLVVAPSIANAQALKGQTFAIPNRFSTHHILLYEMLKKEGLAYEDINVVELPPAEMPAALAQGQIAGYVVAEPFGAISVALKKGKVLYQSEDIWPNSIDCGLVLRNQFIQSHGEVAKSFVRDYVAAGELAEHKDAHMQEVVGEFMNVEQNVLDLSLQWISYDDLAIEEEAYAILRNALIEMKLSEDPPAYEDFVDTSLWQ